MQTRPDREARSSLASMNSHSSMRLVRGTPVLPLMDARRKAYALSLPIGHSRMEYFAG